MKYEYFNISIFYNQKEWHHLLKICLQPLFKKILPESGVEYYFIYLSKERGDNIRISFIIEFGKAQHVIKILNTIIYSFLVENPSSDSIHKIEGDEFFLDFQNNSIRCNLHNKRMSLSDDGLDQIIILRSFISKTIMCSLIEEQIDGESSFTLFMYLLFALIKVYSPILIEAKNSAKKLLSSLQDEFCDIEVKKEIEVKTTECDELFKDNEGIFIAICLDVWNFQSDSIVVPWLNDWEKHLKDYIDKEQTLLFSYTSLYNILSEHLSINRNNKVLSSWVIFRTLEIIEKDLSCLPRN